MQNIEEQFNKTFGMRVLENQLDDMIEAKEWLESLSELDEAEQKQEIGRVVEDLMGLLGKIQKGDCHE